MSLVARLGRSVERAPLPDPLLRLGVRHLVARTRRKLERESAATAAFAAAMAGRPIAAHTDAANRQHYELPLEFFALVLGPRRKYSCCLYPTGGESLAVAERHALEDTIDHAQLADGQEILELGCGWGSLSLLLAERFPASRILAVSNAAAQRRYIEARARAAGLGNLQLLTADMNGFAPSTRFDRILSVEMFEHIANWRALLTRLRAWLRPEGRLFLHVFSHARHPYRFETEDPDDWIAQHFFTGGLMPSHDLIGAFGDLFTLERDWRWSGAHYARTARHWLANYDRNRVAIRPILESVYGADAALWERRWRLFFLATAGLFGHRGGSIWGVSHYRLRPSP